MQMNNIARFLQRFKKMEPVDAAAKRALIEAFKDILNVELDTNQVRVSKKTLFLNVHPTLRMEIYLHKDKLLTRLKSELGHNGIENII